MKDNEKTITIEALSIKDPARRGILYEGKWHTVIGKASDYVPKLQKGTAIVSEDDKGNVTFVSQRQDQQPAGVQPAQKNENFQGTYQKAKDDKITRMNTLDKAIGWVEHYMPNLKTSQEAIIHVQAMEAHFRTFVETGEWPMTGDKVEEEDFEEDEQ